MSSSPSPLAQPHRPNIMGTQHMIVAGHHLAAQAGFQVLEAGGNAVDAGVAAGLALSVVESEMASFGGVAPIILYLAETDEVVTISGLGGWPGAASCEYFHKHHDGRIPTGILRTVVPAAPDAWITVLERWGTFTFADVSAAAIRLAREGFVVYPLLADWIAKEFDSIRHWPANAAMYLPEGRPPRIGEVLKHEDLANTLQFLADEEKAHAGQGRKAGLAAARRAFYQGDVAARIEAHQKDNGGLLTAADMAGFRVGIEPPVRTTFGDVEVWGCGPWCQGPMLLQELNVLEGLDLKAMGHNSVRYLHTLAEAINLAAADRHAYYGDPRFVDVPIEALLSKDYATERRRLIRTDRAFGRMPPPGTIDGHAPGPGPHDETAEASPATLAGGADRLDTSYVCVVDRWGNALSATPSDSGLQAPVPPGLGFVPSPRGGQAWTDPRAPASIAPGKRPRLTPNPAIAIRRGEMLMPFGTPGADVQTQMMLQVFLNMMVFEMDPQTAVEAERIASHNFPGTHDPHDYTPGSLWLQGSMPAATGDALAALGHHVHWYPERGPANTSTDINGVCVIRKDLKSGVMVGGADPRRTAYGLGW